MKDTTLDKWLENELFWVPRKGIGFYPVKPEEEHYDQEYFDIYINYAESPIAEDLNNARVNLIKKYIDHGVLDVGIGCGTFIESCEGSIGTDVNTVGIKWLEDRDILWNGVPVKAATFWDSLEHLPNPDEMLNKVREWAFVSLPIFKDVNHILRSKHFKPTEHRWYFTEEGFINWMYDKGFECVEMNRMEEELGREDIGTYVFKRVK